RIVEVRGQAVRGIVTRAEEVGSRANVAIKTFHVHEQTAVASIRREIHALSRIRHPGVGKILAHGVEEGSPWYAMELIDGQTLDSYLEAIRRHPGQADRGPAPTLRE